jgi:zinc protease
MSKHVLLVTVVALAAGCPKPPDAVTPTLPGDGTTHVAKPADPAKPADDPWANVRLIEPPAAQPPAKLELPPITRFTLPNGLPVMVIKDDRLPLVSMQMAVRAGRADEPRARLGVAEFTANMLVKGTKKRDALGIAKAIDFVGGTLSADASFEATLLGCNVLAKDLQTCLTLLPEIVTQPAFPAAEVEQMRGLMVAGVRQRFDDAGKLASAHLQNLLWGDDHVRGWVVDEDALMQLKRDDLVAWHKQWFSPSNAFLVVAGAVDPKKLQADLGRAFWAWKKTAVPPHPAFKTPTLSGTRIRLVDKPGQTQTHIRVGQFGIAHDDPRFFDTLVWNWTLGGGDFSSRLMNVVRVAGGKSYGASSTFDRNLDKGSFLVATFTRNAEAVETTKLVLGEIKKMQAEGPTDVEVDAAIANIAGGYALKFQSGQDIASALVAAELHGFGEEYLANYALAVGQVTPATAREVAAEILDPRNYVIVLVGDARELEPQLKKANWKFQTRRFNEPITAVPAAPAPAVAPVVADPKAIAAATKLLDDALATKGGEQKLKALKSMTLAVKGTTSIQGQTAPIKMSRTLVLPDKLRVDIDLADGALVLQVGVVGKKGWSVQPAQDGSKMEVVDIPADAMFPIESDRWRDSELVLLRHKEAGAKVTPLADESVDNVPHAVIRVERGDGKIAVDLYIAKATKLLSRMVYSDPETGKKMTDDFGDYKPVSGIKVAHKRASAGSGRATTYEITKVEFDGKVDDAIFAKPSAPP